MAITRILWGDSPLHGARSYFINAADLHQYKSGQKMTLNSQHFKYESSDGLSEPDLGCWFFLLSNSHPSSFPSCGFILVTLSTLEYVGKPVNAEI